jgi:hypothetical protein
MRVLGSEKGQDYAATVPLAAALPDVPYGGNVTFFAYWNGQLSSKQLASVQSCYLFNVKGRAGRKIVVWLENNEPNEFNSLIAQFAELVPFDETRVVANTPLEGHTYHPYRQYLSYYSDMVRYALLYKYGGVWFDLDVLFLRSLDPVLSAFGKDVCVYAWEYQPYPNNALYISLTPQDSRLKVVIDWYICKRSGFGFQGNNSYADPLDLLVLPCAWFDPGWVRCPPSCPGFDEFMAESAKSVSLATFCPGVFAYHWHNRWNVVPHSSSPFVQLSGEIERNLLST